MNTFSGSNGLSYNKNAQVGVTGRGSNDHVGWSFNASLSLSETEVKNAYDVAKAAGSQYVGNTTWNNVAWFCYGEGLLSYDITFSSQSTAKLTSGSSTLTSATTDWTGDWSKSATTSSLSKTKSASYVLSADEYKNGKVTWSYKIKNTDKDSTGKAGIAKYYISSSSSNISGTKLTGSSALKTTSIKSGNTLSLSGTLGSYSNTEKVSSLVSVGKKDVKTCRVFYHNSKVKMKNDGSYDDYYDPNTYSEACISLSYPYDFHEDPDPYIGPKDPADPGTPTIGEDVPIGYDIDISGSTDLPGDLKYNVLYFFTGVNGKNADGNSTYSNGSYTPHSLSISSDSPSTSDLCSALGLGTASTSGYPGGCASLGSGKLTTAGAALDTTVPVPDEETYVGAKICAVVVYNYWTESGSYYGYDDGVTQWGTSNTVCSPIYKKPNFRVTGAPVYSASGIESSVSKKVTTGYDSTGYSFGSWSEDLLTTGAGAVTGFSSGAALSFGLQSDSSCKRSPLTATNNNCNTTLGQAGITTSTEFLTKLRAYLTALDESGTDTVSLGDNNFKHSSTHNNICYVTSSGSLTISSNITTSAECAVIVVMAEDIHVNSNVTQVDAWLVATNAVYTCDSYKTITALSAQSGDCSGQLTINGPVYASRLYLARTYGADGQGGVSSSAKASDATSAEAINLDASAYVWAYEESTSAAMSKIDTVYSQELAPRY